MLRPRASGPGRRRTPSFVLALTAALTLVTAAPAAAAVPLPSAPLPAAPMPGDLVLADPVPKGHVRESQQWVFDSLNTEQAWQVTKGRGATVAVIDSGVDDKIPELRGQVTHGPDMRLPSFDDDVGADPGRHGTAMASLIGGTGKDDGILGVAPEAKLLSVPMIDDQPVDNEASALGDDSSIGRDSPLARAIRYATNHGAGVISMSLGGYGPHPAEREAVSYALGRGVVLVAAVGNDGQTPYANSNGTSFWSFPAGYSGVIGVGAVDTEGQAAPFSSDNLSVLVAAPGVSIPVALPGGGHEFAEGTSASAALVAGVAALIKARYPAMTPEMVARALSESARGTPVDGYDDKVGFGVVDAAGALELAGRLAGQQRSVEVPRDQHFGRGPLSAAPEPPGPDPLRLWLYAGTVALGLIAFGGAVVLLTRRAEQRSAPAGPPPEPPGPPLGTGSPLRPPGRYAPREGSPALRNPLSRPRARRTWPPEKRNG
ncbi:subtilisin family serine protease [Thermocatellispora tengchongensis]|uniref:Subtilisin family serine protease n=1 Tax=Thermocatellispora tengchongensis TaxID=1073253 RepID=A0A840P9K7_9ACTN|nr:S8 family serine peptidase [Thermocatellispora tengchongensis]MBB5133887.1 subtilisin family serine protease [Thermocatellispora tengchongensis]